MAYIGNTVQNQGFAPAIDYFNGNGVTVTFTLSRPVASVAQLIVAIDNVIQNPSSAFTVAGNAITFTSAPLAGTNNIWVEYTSLITTYQGISQDPTVIGDIRATGGYLAEGDFGNSFVDGNLIDYVTGRGRLTVGELDDITFYHGGTSARSPMMDLYYAGGAKIYGTTALTIPVGTTGERPGTPAVGMTRFNTNLNLVEVYNGTAWVAVGDQTAFYSAQYLVIAGGGGAGGYDGSTYGSASNGSNSVISGTGITTVTSLGGGFGGTWTLSPAGSGGAGGGGTGYVGSGGSLAGGSGTSGQGYAGGNGFYPGGNSYIGGGGGGAGSVGQAGNSSNNGNGGSGVTSSITGTAVARAGGGGGGSWGAAGAAAGTATAGGGAGAVNGVGSSGTANTGGGGGAGDNGSGAGSGGAGAGGYRSSVTGESSGGGASAEAQLSLNPGVSYTVTVGAGGARGSNNGGNGGSGIVIIRYLGAQRGTGGTVTSSGGYTIHTFTSSGTYTA